MPFRLDDKARFGKRSFGPGDEHPAIRALDELTAPQRAREAARRVAAAQAASRRERAMIRAAAAALVMMVSLVAYFLTAPPDATQAQRPTDDGIETGSR
jgi:hypothetical protein